MSEDVNEHLIGHLKARAVEGMETYGIPLHPFNGRNPLKDKREELLDALVYNEQDLMEREVIADLLESAARVIQWHEEWSGKNTSDYLSEMGELAASPDYIMDVVKKLRQDIKRIEPEEEQAARLQQALDELSAKE